MTRARIKLRRVKGREATEQEVKQFPKDDRSITATDVFEAFDKGEEVRVRASSGIQSMLNRSVFQRLYTWTLKCQGYDEKFQKEIWDTAPPQHRSKGRGGEAGTAR